MEEDAPKVSRGQIKRKSWVPLIGASGVGFLLGALLFGVCLFNLGPSAWPVGAIVGTAAGLCLVVVFMGATSSARRLRLAQELVRHGYSDEALPLLKEVGGGKATPYQLDTACYLTARAYQLQGAFKLALACYRDYGKRFPKGVWSVEAKTHAREIRRLQREHRALSVSQREAPDLRCPYCRDALLLEKPHVECPTCGTRYHDDCHRERGGCSVFGCASAPRAEERVSA